MKVKVVRKRRPAPVATEQDSKKAIFERWIPMTTDRDTISKAQEICKRTKEVIRRHYCVSSDNNL